MNIMMGQSALSKLQEPTALFEFTLSDPDSNLNTSDATLEAAIAGADDGCSADGLERLCVEFSHPELYSFFLQLEKVQHQLDNLGGVGVP